MPLTRRTMPSCDEKWANSLLVISLAWTDPELKHLAGVCGACSGRSRVGTTKKRADLGSSCHVGHGSATLVVVPNRKKKVHIKTLTTRRRHATEYRRGSGLDSSSSPPKRAVAQGMIARSDGWRSLGNIQGSRRSPNTESRNTWQLSCRLCVV